jgi:hypothetical protein
MLLAEITPSGAAVPTIEARVPISNVLRSPACTCHTPRNLSRGKVNSSPLSSVKTKGSTLLRVPDRSPTLSFLDGQPFRLFFQIRNRLFRVLNPAHGRTFFFIIRAADADALPGLSLPLVGAIVGMISVRSSNATRSCLGRKRWTESPECCHAATPRFPAKRVGCGEGVGVGVAVTV